MAVRELPVKLASEYHAGRWAEWSRLNASKESGNLYACVSIRLAFIYQSCHSVHVCVWFWADSQTPWVDPAHSVRWPKKKTRPAPLMKELQPWCRGCHFFSGAEIGKRAVIKMCVCVCVCEKRSTREREWAIMSCFCFSALPAFNEVWPVHSQWYIKAACSGRIGEAGLIEYAGTFILQQGTAGVSLLTSARSC